MSDIGTEIMLPTPQQLARNAVAKAINTEAATMANMRRLAEKNRVPEKKFQKTAKRGQDLVDQLRNPSSPTER